MKRRLRIVLCMGEYCNLGHRAQRLYEILEPRVRAVNDGFPFDERPVKLETANCLSMCAVGPNCVVYPDDIAYHKLDEAALRELLDDHLAGLETR